MHAGDARHDGSDFFAFLLEGLQVVPENLERKRTLGTSKSFADVVFDRLRIVPDRPRAFGLQLAVHGGDQFVFVLMEYGPPLLVRLQVNKILCVAESTRSEERRVGKGSFGPRGP